MEAAGLCLNRQLTDYMQGMPLCACVCRIVLVAGMFACPSPVLLTTHVRVCTCVLP